MTSAELQSPIGPLTEVRWRLRDLILGSAIVFGSFAVVLATTAAVSIAVGGLEPTPVATVIAAAAEGVTVIVVWRLAVSRYSSGGWSAVGFRYPASLRTVFVIPVILLGSLAFTGLYEVIVATLGVDGLIPQPPPSEMIGEGFTRVLTGVVLAGWVPFVEEVFFRGFLFTGLAARFGVPAGVLGSAAVFALAHVSIGTLVPIFATGILFGWAYWKTRTLWVPICAHGCQNLLATLLIDYA